MKRSATGDIAGLEQCLQPCFQSIRFIGAADRAGSIEAMKDLAMAAPAKVSSVIATRVGDALIVTCLAEGSQTIGGQQLGSAATPRLGVWQYVDSQWRLAAWANLNMPRERPAPGLPTYAGDTTLNGQGSTLLAKFLDLQRKQEMPAFEAMLADGVQVVNFRGQKVRADLIKGAKAATTGPATITEARTTRCGSLTIVTCNLSMSQRFGFATSLPADPAAFLAVFSGDGDATQVIALANTNKPK